MGRTVSQLYSGYCPEHDETATIQVRFAELRILGVSAPQYKKTGYSCQRHCNGSCSVAGESGLNCPVFRAAHME